MTADWRTSAACLGTDPDAWFPEGSAPYSSIVREICAACPVLADCRAWILDYEGDLAQRSRHGMFAGMTPAERWEAYREALKAGTFVKAQTNDALLRPCGTYAAYRRHQRRGELIDEACQAAARLQVAERRDPDRSHRAAVAS